MIRCSVPETNPVDAVRIVAGQPFAHLLAGGALASHGWGGDWQVLAAAPATTLEVRQQQLFRDGVRLGSTADLDPFEILDEMLRARRLPASADDRLPPFLSGALGHVSYEMAAQLEPTLELPGADSGHMAFGFYDAVAAWQCDNLQMEIFARDAAAAGALLDRAVEVWPQGRSEWTPVSERLLVLGQVDALLHGGAYRASTARLIDEVRCTEHHRAALWVAASHDSLSTITAPISPPLPPLPADASYDQRLTRALTLGELGETDASQSMLTALADQPAPSPRLATFVEAARAGGEGAASLAHLREAVALLPCSAAASNALLRARVVVGDPEGAWAEKERLREARLASPDTASI